MVHEKCLRVHRLMLKLRDVTGLCGFWDGSCQKGVCGPGMLMKIFTQALAWARLTKKCGPVPGQSSLDAEIGGCARNRDAIEAKKIRFWRK